MRGTLSHTTHLAGQCQDYPRGCEEHSISATEKATDPGSSPRMRGTLWAVTFYCKCMAIIPADAGSTIRPMVVAPYTEDHPRGCGEHSGVTLDVTVEGGSSPRMRGAHLQQCSDGRKARIIPADAGSTACTWAWTPVPRDHPRGCGEHLKGSCLARVQWGSSPRMRGALLHRLMQAGQSRIIPADAGSTAKLTGCTGIPRDHPRGCGEHPVSTWPIRMVAGSSPRMRGALVHSS